MTTHIISRHPLTRWATAAAAACLLSTNASAQRFVSEGPPPDDPVMQLAEQLAPRNQFIIDSNENVEVIRFKTARDLEICADSARDEPGRSRKGYPIKVDWDEQSAVIAPGNCMAFDAMRVSISAGSRLPENIVLTGTFRILK